MKLLVVLVMVVGLSNARDNGLALTPPMGWLSWGWFRCNTDCANDPKGCIREDLVKDMAKRMKEDGYLSAGYNYVILDDCWMAKQRDNEGRLQPDPDRFPSGMKNLSSHVHRMGLKFGLYECLGKTTGSGFPGMQDTLTLDAQTFADWEVDYLKMAQDGLLDFLYSDVGEALNKTKRPIVYSCVPHMKTAKINLPVDMVKTCNLLRYQNISIDNSWSSVLSIMDDYAENQDTLVKSSGPGHWNDRDMLIIGNPGLSYDQAKVQMAVWSIMAAPLLMSADLRTIKPKFKEILLNKQVIAVNQDPLGIAGKRIKKDGNIEYWRRPITLQGSFRGKSYALAIVNRGDTGPEKVSFTPRDFGMKSFFGYLVTNLYEFSSEKEVGRNETLTYKVNPSGVVMLTFHDYFWKWP